MPEITVHGIPGSPYVRAVLLGCLEKGISYRLQPMAMELMYSAQHLALHPFARIPIIEHGDFRLYETQAILRYINDAFAGPALVPDSPKARARMNQAMGISDSYVFPSISQGIVWNRIIAARFGKSCDESVVQAALPKAQTCINALDEVLGADPYITGSKVSLGDLLLAPHIDFLPGVVEGSEMLKGTRVELWLNRMRGRSSMQATTWDRLINAA